MDIRVWSLASSSRGNCYLIRSRRANILIDVGISCKQILLRLEKLGLSIDDIDAIFLTHEHSDHISGLKVLSKKLSNTKIFSTSGTAKSIDCVQRVNIFNEGDSLELKDMTIDTFSLSHDALNPVGFSVKVSDKKFSVVTDTGKITEDIFNNICDSDILFLEANYEPDILKISSYPRYLKDRIVSDLGHLSNLDTAQCIIDMVRSENKSRQVLLSHLSLENNSPDLAKITIGNILEDARVLPNKNLRIGVLDRDKVSVEFSV